MHFLRSKTCMSGSTHIPLLKAQKFPYVFCKNKSTMNYIKFELKSDGRFFLLGGGETYTMYGHHSGIRLSWADYYTINFTSVFYCSLYLKNKGIPLFK
jgi:hypothetical protein